MFCPVFPENLPKSYFEKHLQEPGNSKAYWEERSSCLPLGFLSLWQTMKGVFGFIVSIPWWLCAYAIVEHGCEHMTKKVTQVESRKRKGLNHNIPFKGLTAFFRSLQLGFHYFSVTVQPGDQAFHALAFWELGLSCNRMGFDWRREDHSSRSNELSRLTQGQLRTCGQTNP